MPGSSIRLTRAWDVRACVGASIMLLGSGAILLSVTWCCPTETPTITARRQLRSAWPVDPAEITDPPQSTTVAYTAAEGYKGQEGQDKWANENVFHGKRAGVFVDLGCYDGITYSNTWFFEKKLGWTGICVEPNPAVFPRIRQQAERSSGVQLALSDRAGTMNMVAAYMRSSLNSSFVDYQFLAAAGVSTPTVQVSVTTPTLLLDSYLPSSANRRIDYVNIDVESQELAILGVWPFGSYCVDVFNIENQPAAGEPSTLPQLRALLLPQGYVHMLRIGVDEVFVRRVSCKHASSLAGSTGGKRSHLRQPGDKGRKERRGRRILSGAPAPGPL